MPDHIGGHLPQPHRPLNGHAGGIGRQLHLRRGQNPARDKGVAAQIGQSGADVIGNLVGRDKCRQWQADGGRHLRPSIGQSHRQIGVLHEMKRLLIQNRQGRRDRTVNRQLHCRGRITHRGVGNGQHRPRHIQIAPLRGGDGALIQCQHQPVIGKFHMTRPRRNRRHIPHEQNIGIAKLTGQRKLRRHIRRDA